MLQLVQSPPRPTSAGGTHRERGLRGSSLRVGRRDEHREVALVVLHVRRQLGHHPPGHRVDGERAGHAHHHARAGSDELDRADGERHGAVLRRVANPRVVLDHLVVVAGVIEDACGVSTAE